MTAEFPVILGKGWCGEHKALEAASEPIEVSPLYDAAARFAEGRSEFSMRDALIAIGRPAYCAQPHPRMLLPIFRDLGFVDQRVMVGRDKVTMLRRVCP